MKTLLQRLKPEIKKVIDEHKSRYEMSVDLIYKSLEDNITYSDLTIDEVNRIYTFSNLTLLQVSIWDFKYGDNIFNKLETGS